MLLLASCLSLTGCDAIFKGLLGGLENNEQNETNYVDHFTNTSGETVYVHLNMKNKTLLKDMQVQIKLDLAKEGEEPDFSGTLGHSVFLLENITI